MPFRYTQLGRFGELSQNYFHNHADPDLRAAHVLARDGEASPDRPLLQAILSSKGLLDSREQLCQSWLSRFKSIRRSYQNRGGRLLSEYCTREWSNEAPGFCLHEFTPPIHYWGLRGLDTHGMNTTVFNQANGFLAVARHIPPLLNYVITNQGDILMGTEDHGWIKHPSLAGGIKVWSAGQVGFENGKIRLVDLQSGHYVGNPNHPEALIQGSHVAEALAIFTRNTFIDYSRIFNLAVVHRSFNCVWASEEV